MVPPDLPILPDITQRPTIPPETEQDVEQPPETEVLNEQENMESENVQSESLPELAIPERQQGPPELSAAGNLMLKSLAITKLY